jgi:hypothetical protein
MPASLTATDLRSTVIAAQKRRVYQLLVRVHTAVVPGAPSGWSAVSTLKFR